MDVAAFSEFTTSIHANVLIRAIWGIAGKPAVDPIDGRSLCRKSTAKDPATEVVGQQNIAGFAV
jgi:hypothetical protein